MGPGNYPARDCDCVAEDRDLGSSLGRGRHVGHTHPVAVGHVPVHDHVLCLVLFPTPGQVLVEAEGRPGIRCDRSHGHLYHLLLHRHDHLCLARKQGQDEAQALCSRGFLVVQAVRHDDHKDYRGFGHHGQWE